MNITFGNQNNEVVLAIGSNFGLSRYATIIRTIKSLSKKHEILSYSSLYTTKPLKYPDSYPKQDNYLNCVVIISTDYSANQLLSSLQSYEKKNGRMINRKPFWHRKLDIDIIYYKNKIIDNQLLTVPHIERLNRDFVLKPITEIRKFYKDPVSKKLLSLHISKLNSKNHNNIITKARLNIHDNI